MVGRLNLLTTIDPVEPIHQNLGRRILHRASEFIVRDFFSDLQYLDLDSVIQRHAGEAIAARDAYRELSEVEQEAIQAFLRVLVLYQTDQLPCDINGDGKVSDEFFVSGKCVGMETFRPEWLLNTPCRIEGEMDNVLGTKFLSRGITNLREAYGLDLEYISDRNQDGWPDRFSSLAEVPEPK